MAIKRFTLLRTSTVNRAGSAHQSDKAPFLRSLYEFCGPRLFAKLLAAFLIFAGLLVAREAKAGFASGFSLGLGEEFNDNIFFSNETGKRNVHDFVTHFVPTFSILYAPPGETTPTFTASLSTEGQIFAHRSDLNNFGDNVSFNSGYTYRYSPRLTFHVADTLSRRGGTRTIGLEALGPPQQLPGTPTQQPPAGAFVPLPLIQDVGGLVTKGSTLANFVSLEAAYLYTPNFTISGGYGTGYSNTKDGSETSHTVGIRGIYNWRQEHHLFAGYSVTVIDSGNGNNSHNGNSHNGRGTNVVHNIDIGDDYFSALKVQLDPTWTLSGSFGIGLNTGGGGPAVVNNASLTLIKIWQAATFNVAIRRGLTSSFGISGLSTTTSFSSGFGIRLTERLTGILGVDYSLFDTQDVNFNVFRASAGLQYWITNWLSSNLLYSRRFRHAGPGSNDVNSGNVSGDSILLALSVHFDLWPNPALARGAMHPLYPPMGAPLYAPPELQQPLRLPPGTLPGQPQSPVPSQPPASP